MIDEGSPPCATRTRPPQVRLSAVTHGPVHEELTGTPLRDFVSPSTAYPLLVERELALYGAWYEFFPRCEGALYDEETHTWRSGTLRTAAQRLPAIADMGFDVIYLTPIHPIGQAAKKGRNNTLDAGPEDPGTPYAIGSPDGGHDAIHPDLGTFEDFDSFVAEARRHGLEVAIDIALQSSPDHPWVQEHPEWFTTRADGTIAYAENPPKKYQDIYPLNFDNDPAGAYAEVRRVIQVWLDHGVTLFRVDNPHTKPVEFWQWLIADVARDHPETIWLSEAFTKPAMMHTLAKAGFQQSYTYYAWRNAKPELEEYGEELADRDARTTCARRFWPTTHDILTPYMQFGGPAAWKLRAALAGTMVPTYGIYAGYELMEHVARPGRRGADRQREVRVQGPPLVALRARRPAREPVARLVPQAAQRDPPRPPGAALAAQPPLPPRRRRELHGLQQEPRGPGRRRDGRPEHEDVVIVIANLDPHAPAGAACPRHGGPRAGTWTTASTRTTTSPTRRGTSCARTWSTSGPTTSRSTSSAEEPLTRTPCRDSTSPSRGSSTTPSGSRRPSSTRCSSAPSPTPTAPAPATSPGSSTGSTTSSGSASTASGCRRSTPPRCVTAATTSPTTSRCCRSSARCPSSASSSRRRTPAASGSSPTS